tara:strand:- start:1743 stop:2333 length:591 start_codon:yes stop_codon:yes gene_type:complete
MKKGETYISGKCVQHYIMPSNEIDDLNHKYENIKDNLNSYGALLAGRLDSELSFTHVLTKTEIYKTITKCIDNYIDTLIDYHLLEEGKKHLEIISCWINDMVQGEYNPPHTHHNGTGFSSVLFLKVPEFIHDEKDPHKFKDGKLCFIMNQDQTSWMTPKVGDFYLFQANHQHCVMPFKTKLPNDMRRSMSFNFIIK